MSGGRNEGGAGAVQVSGVETFQQRWEYCKVNQKSFVQDSREASVVVEREREWLEESSRV